MSPPNSYIEAPTLNVTAFADRTFKEVIKVKGGHKGVALIQYDRYPYKKRKRHQGSVCTEKGPREDTG